jgi:hypothetical protein
MAAFVLGAAVLGSSREALSEPGTDLLPDLKTLDPKDLQIENVTVGGQNVKRLRLDNEVLNAPALGSGIGVLEIYSIANDCNGNGNITDDRSAVQRIYQDANADGHFTRGVDTASTTHAAGCMVFHEAHDHWHFDGFSRYELKQLPGTNGTVVASSEKVTFCIADVWRRAPALPGSPSSKYYTGCGKVSTQGLSVGWSDEYPYTTAGQYIELDPGGTYIGDGDYCLVSIADPSGLVSETDETNNEASVEIRLSRHGKKVQAFPGTSCGGAPAESW